MHESSLLKNLMRRIDETARQSGGGRVSVVRLKLGPLAHIDPDHLREHFEEAAVGTIAEHARLEIQTTEDWHELTLESIDVEPDAVR